MNYFAFGLTIQTDISFDGVLQPSVAQPDVLILEDYVPEKAGRQTRLYRRGIQARLGIVENGFVLNWASVGKFRVTAGNRITYQNMGADDDTLRLFLLSEVIGIILYQRGRFLLHASAVAINGQAAVFMGVPGAGKSTTATAFGKAGCTVLTDDLVVIDFINNKPQLIPAFSQYKVWKSALDGLGIDATTLAPSFEGANKFLITQPVDQFPVEPLPLRQLMILYPPTSRIKEGQIRPITAPVELLKHFPLPVQLLTPVFLQQHFFQALQIAQTTPIRFMKRTNDFSALETFVAETVQVGYV